MKHVVMISLGLGLGIGLSGCGLMDRLRKPEPVAAPVVAATPAALPALGAGQTAEALDAATPAEQAAAVAPVAAASEVSLGEMVVALGSPAEQGFWLKSVKVATPGKGRVVTAGGASVAVDLLPGTGGALLSLSAFRALGLGLTDLPAVQVYAN